MLTGFPAGATEAYAVYIAPRGAVPSLFENYSVILWCWCE